MIDMDAFEELGITAVATTPNSPSTSRTIGEAVTTVVAGTALIASGIAGLVLIAIFALVFSAPTL
jgi:methyl coenzyme M reductase subunit C